MLEAVERFGAVKGVAMGLGRIGRCHPWHPGGFDPVPSLLEENELAENEPKEREPEKQTEAISPSSARDISAVLAEMTRWSAARSDITAAALVGSHARGTAHVDSDIDVMVLTANLAAVRTASDWMEEIDWESIGAAVDTWKDVDYGPVWSRHVSLVDGMTIELSFGPPEWASVNPVDAGTASVVRDGCKPLYDPELLLHALVDVVRMTG